MLVHIFPKHTRPHHDLTVTNAAENATTASGWIVGGDIYNPGGSVAYLQLFDLAAADVVLGTTVARWTLAIPATGAREIDPPRPIQCLTRISYAVTATRTGAGAPAASCTMTLVVA